MFFVRKELKVSHKTFKKIDFIFSKTFNDCVSGKISVKEFVIIDKHRLNIMERVGFILSNLNASQPNYEFEINTKLRGFEMYLKNLEEQKKKENGGYN